MVDTRGECLMTNLEAQTRIVSQRAGAQSVHKTASILFVVQDTRDVLMQSRNYYGRALPPVSV